MFIALHARECMDTHECVCGGRRLIEATYYYYLSDTVPGNEE